MPNLLDRSSFWDTRYHTRWQNMLLKGYLTSLKCARVTGDKSQLWKTNLSKAISLSLVAYGITGLNVSLAYFDLIYALLAVLAVLSAYKGPLQLDRN